MELLSLQFIALVCCLVPAFYLVGKRWPQHQWIILLAGSLLFYFSAGGWKAFIYLIVTSLDVWCASHAIARIDAQSKQARKETKDRKERKAIKERFDRQRRRVFIAALLIPLGILGYFKYLNVILFNFGAAETPTSLGIMLPIGISFYTFQALGYLIDSYNSKYAPEPSYPRFLLFVSWFPQIVQGPIGRYDQLSEQLLSPREANLHGMRKGLLRLGYGFFKKIAIANVIAHNVVYIFEHVVPGIPGSVVVYGVLCYSLQMYADFSGGIDIVEGISELFGVTMAQNFRQPYFSVSLADFWRRWHMSLGSWMRDYIFYPIALTKPMQNFGKWSRAHLSTHVGRTLPACIANILVFLLVGVWHGADWHYVAWGLYNGVVVALSDLLAPTFLTMKTKLRINDESRWFHVFAIIRTFIVVNIGRYFDCVTSVADSFTCLYATLFNFSPIPYREALSLYLVDSAQMFGFSRVIFIGYLVIFIVSWHAEKGVDVRERILSWHPVLRCCLYAALGAIILYSFGHTIDGGGGFLYANF